MSNPKITISADVSSAQAEIEKLKDTVGEAIVNYYQTLAVYYLDPWALRQGWWAVLLGA